MAKVRATIGSLRDRRVAPRTLSYYLQALTWLFTYFSTWHIAIPDDTATFDELVGEAIDFAWSQGKSRAMVGHILSGLVFVVPALYGHLRLSWNLWRTWAKLQPPVRAAPVTLLAVQAFCFEMVCRGFPAAATLTLLAFNRFLRSAEFLSLTAGQLVFSLSLIHI